LRSLDENGRAKFMIAARGAAVLGCELINPAYFWPDLTGFSRIYPDLPGLVRARRI
jgi:hypothetical protein